MYINASADPITVKEGWARADLDLIDQLAAYPVALIGDARQRMGMMVAAISAYTGNRKIAGTILPAVGREGDNLVLHVALDYAQPGDVLVVNANSEVNRSVFGDILAEICIQKGVRGVIIDGSIRDVEAMNEFGFPAFARGVCPAGPAKNGPGVVGLPVACGNVVCYPGDAIFGDADGIVIVPAAELQLTLDAVVRQDAIEATIREKVRADRAVLV